MNRHILIITENEESAQKAAAAIKEYAGEKGESWSVKTASGLVAALGFLAEKEFNAVLLEPGKKAGLEDIHNLFRLMGRRMNAPVIIINGPDDPEIEDQALLIGIDDYLRSNAMTPRGLGGTLRRAILRYQYRRQRPGGQRIDLDTDDDDSEEFEGLNLLVVEDEEVQRTILTKTLENLGYLVRSFESGEDAIEAAKEWKPVLSLLDLNLPGINGIETAERLRSISGLEHTPAIMISADYEEKTVVQALMTGIYDFVSKPLRKSELSVRIHNALNLKNKETQLRSMASRLEKEKRLMSRYFADDFIEKLLKEEISSDLGGAEINASIMFFDLRNSTGIGEKLTAESFSDFLSEVFNDIMELVLTNQGSVNKLMGDGMLATYGCPLPGPDDPLHCVTTAIRIREYIDMYNQISPHGLDTVRFGIGISTGKVFAGNIGSFRRIEYTVLGNPVNTAARLEALTKKAGVDIMIDAGTRKALGNRIKVRRVRTRIRGKTRDEDVYVLDELISSK